MTAAATTLRIDRVVVELTSEQRPAEVEETLRQALAVLSTRLAGLPLGGQRDAPVRALDLVELGPVSPDWLSSAGAAERLADQLYQRLTEGMR